MELIAVKQRIDLCPRCDKVGEVPRDQRKDCVACRAKDQVRLNLLLKKRKNKCRETTSQRTTGQILSSMP